MNRSGRALSGLVLACAVVLAACDDGPAAPTSTPAPTPAPAPAPAPAPTFRVTGTVVETAPRAGRPIENVQAALSTGPSAATGGDGSFTITGVAAGTYTLTLTKADYQTTTRSVTVASGDVTVPQISLPPTPRIVSEEHMGALGPDEAVCHGTSRSCDAYYAGSHNPGRVEAQVTWSSDATELDLELRCNDELVEEAFKKGGTSEELGAEIPGGKRCALHVLHSGDATNYRLFLRYPF